MPFVVTSCAYKVHRARGRGRGKLAMTYFTRHKKIHMHLNLQKLCTLIEAGGDNDRRH